MKVEGRNILLRVEIHCARAWGEQRAALQQLVWDGQPAAAQALKVLPFGLDDLAATVRFIRAVKLGQPTGFERKGKP